VTHINLNTTPPMLDLAHAQEVAKLGGYLEFASQSQRPGNPTLEQRNARTADLIRKLGPQYAILETDLGQVDNEPAPDGLAAFIINLRAKGFTKAETDLMTKINPAKLLGLPLP
jgi:predicted metal-dependent phosphotriesterase family hydrolase